MTEIRAFLALEIPEAAKNRISELQTVWKRVLPRARWVPPANLHITVRFLGGVAADRLDRLAETLGETVSGSPEIPVRLDRLGCFPSLGRARVAWIGGAAEGGAELARVVDTTLSRFGFERERRPWSMHLTVARPKAPWRRGDGERFASDEGSLGIGPFVCRELVLFESDLRPSGAVYTARRRFPLGVH